MLYRHGDILLKKVSSLPKGLSEVKHQGSFVVAEGEHTGHKHLLTIPKMEMMKVYRDETGGMWVELREQAVMTHEEHKQIEIAPDFYQVTNEREFDYALQSVRQVLD